MKAILPWFFSLGLLTCGGCSAAVAHPNHALDREGLAHLLLSYDHWLANVLVLLWMGLAAAWALSFLGTRRKATVD